MEAADGWQANPGRCPGYLKGTGKRVHVMLRNGMKPPESWAADGKGACNWRFTPEGKASREFDIVKWKEAK